MICKKSIGEHVFDSFNIIFMIVFSCIFLTPFLHIIFASISDPSLLAQNRGIILWPKGFTMEGYRLVLKNPNISAGFLNTLIYVSVGTFINMRTSFKKTPVSLIEAAKLDGANHFTIFYRIVVPVSKAVIAVITLFYAVGHWNSWFNAMIFLNNRKLFPLQLILREILILNDTSSMANAVNVEFANMDIYKSLVKYATIVVATVPILCIYPFIQKHFTKGVMIGSVKG